MSSRKRTTGVVAVLVGTAVTGALLAPVAAAAAEPADVLINEAYLKGGSANAPYTHKFIELYNAGGTAQSLDGWSLQYRSASGTGAPNGTLALSGSIAAGDHFLVALGSNGSNGAALPEPDLSSTSINPSGTTGTIFLADTSSPVTLATGSIVGVEHVVDLLGYGTSNTFEGTAAAVDGANSVPNSLVRTDFVDTDVNSADFANATTVTPESSTASPEPEPTGTATPTPTPTPTAAPEAVEISAIQGTGEASPLAGQTVTTRGVVTAAYPTGGFNGFYIQTPGTGGAIDLAAHTASDAVFVYGSQATAKVAIGDYVEVTGPVSEYNGLTEISPTAANVTVIEPAATTTQTVAPAELAWPEDEAGRESIEGMLFAPQGDFTVSDTYDTNYYASIGLAAGTTPLMTPTEVANPDDVDAYAAVVADNAARALTLDDGASINFNSSANKGIPLPYLSLEEPVRVGAPVTFTQPVVVDYRNSLWNLQPTQQLTVDNAAAVQPATFENTRTDGPADVGGDIQIASFNVLNYFTTTGEDAEALGASCTYYADRVGDPVTVNTCSAVSVRGAAEEEDLLRQQAKIVAAVNGLGAEVVSLEEIENSTIAGEERDAAVAALVEALNADLGADEWAYAPSPATVPAGEDVIRTAFIYKKDAVELVGDSVIDDDAAFSNARYPLAQAFQPVGGDEDDTFLAIVNHFKSKGSGSGVDADQGDGQGASNASRVAQAEALVDFADGLQAEVGTDDVFLIGDFNAYTQEDPMQVLYEAGYVDQGEKTGKETYSFDGQIGSLDHILASASAEELVSGADIWNINSGESIALEYSRYNYNATSFYDESPYRSSDHDPIVVGVDFADAETSTINLLNINDFHGRIDGNTVAFAGTIEQLRAEYGDDSTLFLSAGDNIGASLFASSVADDQPTLDVLDALELAVSAVGNHEFDKGLSDLTGRVSDEADFPYLGANVYAVGTDEPALQEYATFEVDGLTVGVIGVVTEETATLVSPGGIADVEFGDPVAAVNRVAAQLTDGDAANGEADIIVAEYHEGSVDGVVEGATLEEEVAAGGAFASIVEDTSAEVDVIFTGHTHKEYAWDAPVPGSTTGETRPVIQTGNYGENIGQVVLEVDGATGDVVSYEAANVDRTTTAADTLIATYPRVAEVDGIVDAALAVAAEIGEQPVGEVTADITTAFGGGSYVDGVWTGGARDNRAAQSALGNLVADSLVSSLSSDDRGGAEIGVVNPGGLRNELYAGTDGVITYAEANAVLPFVNNLWTTTLTGAEFEEVLEQQWQPDGSSRPYLQLGLSSNVTYTSDASQPRGERITGVWIDGEPIDPAAEYRIGSFSFLLQGGDNFTAFSEGDDTRDSGLVDRDAWIDYIEANSPLSPDFASTTAQVTGIPAGQVSAGDTVELQVSGFDLTSLGSPANTVLEPAIEGSAAEFADVAVTDGAATVSVVVPEDAPEDATLVLTAPDSGTEIRVALEVAPTGGADVEAAADASASADADGSGAEADASAAADADAGAAAAAEADASAAADGSGAEADASADADGSGAEADAAVAADADAGADASAADADGSGAEADASAAADGSGAEADASAAADGSGSEADASDDADASADADGSGAEADASADADGSEADADGSGAGDDGAANGNAANAAANGNAANAAANGNAANAAANGNAANAAANGNAANAGANGNSANAGANGNSANAAANGNSANAGANGNGDGKPSSAPTPASDDEIDAATGILSVVSGDIVPGGDIVLNVGEQYAGEWAAVWMHSTPQLLGGGWLAVDASGEVAVTLPSDASGTHRLVAQDASGAVIGVLEITFAADDSGLAPTGGEIAGVAITSTLLLLLAGAISLTVVRRRRA
ncbi:ExeM/NucH family extracellular endonuclease [Microbacterium sp. NPDC055683]